MAIAVGAYVSLDSVTRPPVCAANRPEDRPAPGCWPAAAVAPQSIHKPAGQELRSVENGDSSFGLHVYVHSSMVGALHRSGIQGTVHSWTNHQRHFIACGTKRLGGRTGSHRSLQGDGYCVEIGRASCRERV